MDELRLPNNIIRLRHERKITQEVLADFLGVTKASVSKWENAQSTPDLPVLLQLAAYFDMTLDELIGYEAQLTREQIRRFYTELSADFAERPFEETTEKVCSLAHRYYSCYPFLLQLCVLYLNHFMLAETENAQMQILKETALWCDHIIDNCSDVNICSDALILKANISLCLGNAKEVVGILEPTEDPIRLSGQKGLVLVKAYQMVGEYEKAKSHIQIREYMDLLNLMSDAMMSLALHIEDLERCRITICRIRTIMEQYQLEQLHPNLAAQFHYQAAAVYAANGEEKEALEALRLFDRCALRILHSEKVLLQGDSYFDRLDEWIARLPLGNIAPRSKEFIPRNIRDSLCCPAFESIKETSEFQRILNHFSS